MSRPHIQNAGDVVQHMYAAVGQGNPDYVNALNDCLHQSVAALRPQNNALQALITQNLQYLRQTKTGIVNHITDIA